MHNGALPVEAWLKPFEYWSQESEDYLRAENLDFDWSEE